MTRDEHIPAVVDAAPPLSSEQISRLSTLFDTDTSGEVAASANHSN